MSKALIPGVVSQLNEIGKTAKKPKDFFTKQFYNRITASFHAATLFILTCTYWALILRGGNSHHGHLQVFCIDIMLGYIVYDTCHEVSVPFTIPGLSSDMFTVAHHILGALSLSTAIYFECQECCRYFMLIFLAEASTPLLHFGWLLHLLGSNATNSNAFKLLYIVTMILFFIFRVILGPYVFKEVVLSKNMHSEFPALYFLNTFVVGSYCLLNFKW